jgi:hypothetical protein
VNALTFGVGALTAVRVRQSIASYFHKLYALDTVLADLVIDELYRLVDVNVN